MYVVATSLFLWHTQSTPLGADVDVVLSISCSVCIHYVVLWLTGLNSIIRSRHSVAFWRWIQ